MGKNVMKQFAEGLFKGQVMTATKKRGRYLYHVVYEDGDEEDLNDQEFIEAYELFYKAGNKTYEAVEKHTCHNDKSGGETEGSEYDMSEDESVKRKRQKRRKTHNKPLKEKETNGGEKTSKEEDTTKTRKKKLLQPLMCKRC